MDRTSKAVEMLERGEDVIVTDKSGFYRTDQAEVDWQRKQCGSIYG